MATPLRVALCPDSFTEFRSAPEVCAIYAAGARDAAEARGVSVELRAVPMADGGAGTLDVLHGVLGGTWRRAPAKDPLGEPLHAEYLLLPDRRAAIEVARASGIELCKHPVDRRHPLFASTFGTGELLLDAWSRGSRDILIALGGSATSDGGVGLAQAMGAVLLDEEGRELADRRAEGYGAASLLEAARADLGRMFTLPGTRLTVACDVDNALLGENGAAAVFGPQKGATPEMVPLLEQALERWAGWVEERLGHRVRDLPGTGAAGGLGFALAALFHGDLARGAALVADAVGLDAALAGADLVITGEGCFDRQTFMGKAVHEVARRAREQSPKALVVVVAGSVAADRVAQSSPLIDRVFDASEGRTLSVHEIEADGERSLRRAAALAVNWYLDQASGR